jgi:predicted nucleic acid-binding protein
MTQPLFVDTGGWIAYFDKSDNAHYDIHGLPIPSNPWNSLVAPYL